MNFKEPLIPKETHTLIIGGGIVGAGIFRSLSLNGLPCMIIDKDDFASKTSQWSSKMLHGGVRYLETYDFSLVREALIEKNLWTRIAPHLCYEKRFYLPVYKNSKNPLWKINLGLWIYDLLSSFTNTPHECLNKESTMKQVPGLKSKNLQGSGVYYDAIVDDAKLALETIYDGALEPHAHAINHLKYLSHHKNGSCFHVELQDQITNERHMIECKKMIFALGPYTDTVISKFKKEWTPKMLPSKGVHLWVHKSSLPVYNPLLLSLSDGRVMFIIPQKERILLGTTETKATNIDCPEVDREDIVYILKNIRKFFPDHPITEKHILGKFAGIRPLVSEGTGDLGKTSREHKNYLIDKNIYAIAGGKLTTYRVMGNEICEEILNSEKMNFDCDLTLNQLRQPSTLPPFENIEVTKEHIQNILQYEYVRTKEDMVLRLGLIDRNNPFERI